MPTRLLSVPHKPQENEAGCLAACAQMVLQVLGIEHSQASLNRLLGLTSIGTPFSNLRRLTQLGVEVILQPGSEADLRDAIDRNQSPILFLFTGDLSYWSENTSHAVVVVGYDDKGALLNDPQFDAAPQSVSWSELMLAWGEHDYMFGLVVATQA